MEKYNNDNIIYYKKIVQYMKRLSNDHPDKGKFCLEQASIRMGNPFTSYLINLQDSLWEEKVELVTYGRNRFTEEN